jgi:hypothetical protein
MRSCEWCGARPGTLPVRVDIVRESGPIGLSSDPAPGTRSDFTKGYAFCSSAHLYEWLREHRYMLCNRQPTPVEDGMQPLMPSRHMAGRVGLCDGHHLGGHEWKEAWQA